jgi:hypothetical protein
LNFSRNLCKKCCSDIGFILCRQDNLSRARSLKNVEEAACPKFSRHA